MATTATGLKLNHVQRQRLKDAEAPVADVSQATTDLKKIRESVEDLQDRRDQAQRRFDKDSLVSGRYLSDEARTEAREKALDALREVESDVAFELRVLGARAQSITAQLSDAAELPTLSALDPEVVRDASSMAPLVQVQLAGLPLSGIAQRLRAAQIRANPAEVLAFATAARAHLAQRRDAPQPGDSDSDFFAAEGLVRQMQEANRDTRFDDLLKAAHATVQAVTGADRQITRDRSARGEEITYAFLEGIA